MKKLMKYLVGDVEEKRAWRRTMKRVATLPEDYRFVYEKNCRVYLELCRRNRHGYAQNAV